MFERGGKYVKADEPWGVRLQFLAFKKGQSLTHIYAGKSSSGRKRVHWSEPSICGTLGRGDLEGAQEVEAIARHCACMVERRQERDWKEYEDYNG